MEEDIKSENIENLEEENESDSKQSFDLDDIIKMVSELAGKGQGQGTIIKNLYYIKENAGLVVGDDAEIEEITFQKEAKNNIYSRTTNHKCMIDDKVKLIEWLSEHYNDFEMAFMISVAVFERTPYLWVYDMAESLYELMEKEEALSTKVKIPNNQRLEVIGAKKYRDYIYNHTGKIESEFICFQNDTYAQIILVNVWQEFIFLRDTLLNWLNNYISTLNYSKAIMAVNAIALFASCDFDYFYRNEIKILFKKNEFMTDFAVAQIMSQVYEDDRYQDNVKKLFLYWSKGGGVGNVHYSLTALLTCMIRDWKQDKIEIAVREYFNEILKSISTGSESRYKVFLPVFFSIGRRRAEYFKAVVSVLYDKLTECNRQREKRNIGILFFWLLTIDDQQSNVDVINSKKNKDMIFVKMCLIKNDTAIKVRALWRFIWTNRELRRPTKAFLEKYLYQYGGCEQAQIDYLRQFLYSFQESNEERENMDYFLKKISLRSKRSVRAAERINH